MDVDWRDEEDACGWDCVGVGRDGGGPGDGCGTDGGDGGEPHPYGETVMNGAPKRPMTFADLMAVKRVSDPQISPSGKWVMFSVMDVSLEKNTKVNHLWVVPLAGGHEWGTQ